VVGVVRQRVVDLRSQQILAIVQTRHFVTHTSDSTSFLESGGLEGQFCVSPIVVLIFTTFEPKKENSMNLQDLSIDGVTEI
jgi:hypothetical protein